MYVYFDKNGVLKEVLNDNSIRVGNSNSDEIYVYLEGFSNIGDIYWTMEKSNGDVTNEISFKNSLVTASIPYNKNRDMKYFEDFKKYNFYKIKLTTSDLSVSGLAKITIRIVMNNSIYARGLITFNVADSVIKADNLITQSQYDYLLSKLGNYAHINGSYDNFFRALKLYFKDENGTECNVEEVFKTKLDKVTSKSNRDRIYLVLSNGTQSTRNVTTGVENNTIPQRKGNGGALEVGTPTGNNDATTKKYVDDELELKANTSDLDNREYDNITLKQMSTDVKKAIPNREYVDDEITKAKTNHIKSASVSINQTTGTYTMHFKDENGDDLFTCNWDTPDEYIIDTTKEPLVQTRYNDDGSVATQTTTIYLYGGTSFTIDTTSLALSSGSISSDDVKIVVANGKIKATLSERLTNMISAESVRISNENIRISNERVRQEYFITIQSAIADNYQVGGYKLYQVGDKFVLDIKPL